MTVTTVATKKMIDHIAMNTERNPCEYSHATANAHEVRNAPTLDLLKSEMIFCCASVR
jgi:hypothetical protein